MCCGLCDKKKKRKTKKVDDGGDYVVCVCVCVCVCVVGVGVGVSVGVGGCGRYIWLIHYVSVFHSLMYSSPNYLYRI